MKILVAGATGALGKQLVPQLVERGHEVVGMTRREARRPLVEELGARAAVADGLDPEAVAQAVAEAVPEVIVHEMTALAGNLSLRNIDRTFAQTNRLRTEGTDHLLSAGRAVGVKRFVVQSFAGWPFARVGGPVKTEEDPLDPSPPKEVQETMAAIRHLESAVREADWTDGIVLRYGGFYGPGTSFAKPDGQQYEMVRKRRFPLVGEAGGIWSLVHIADAASATAQAVEHGPPGIYNVVDDEPAPVSEFLPYAAKVIGAKPPRRLPVWLARLISGEAGVAMMTEIRGASNAKAKRELGWKLRYPSWRQGFAAELG
ncbi:MAG: NAD-dependent epimerase/dehydratase family protein [Solirubrobacterales bacterium]